MKKRGWMALLFFVMIGIAVGCIVFRHELGAAALLLIGVVTGGVGGLIYAYLTDRNWPENPRKEKRRL